MTPCTYCGAARTPGQMHVCNEATERQRVIREANAAGAVRSATLASLRADAPGMREALDRVLDRPIGKDVSGAEAHAVARIGLALMEALGLV
jgi:hypothetical protein